VWVARIYTPEKYRGKGYARTGMLKLCEDADLLRVNLHIAPGSYGPMRNRDLVHWWKRLGFEKRDGSDTGYVRYPKGAVDCLAVTHPSGCTLLEKRNGWNVYRTGLPVGRPEAMIVAARNDERFYFEDRAGADDFTSTPPCPFCGKRVKLVGDGFIEGHTNNYDGTWRSCDMSGQAMPR
jgi:hypothetical protein